MVLFIAQLLVILLIGTVFVIISDIPWVDISKPGATGTVKFFYERVQVGIDIYILHLKYLVKPHLFPLFSAVFAAAIAHRNHFFRLYQQNKSFATKFKFRQAISCCKNILEAAEFAYS